MEALRQVWQEKQNWQVHLERLTELDSAVKEAKQIAGTDLDTALKKLANLQQKHRDVWGERHDNILRKLRRLIPRQEPLILAFRDVNPDVVLAWSQVLSNLPNVSIGTGSVLQARIDAVVSPANSFGYMDGGIDLAYRDFFGLGIQNRLQEVIRNRFGGELPVGEAVCIPTGHPKIKRMIAAPTMRKPVRIVGTDNVHKAMKAALLCANDVRPEIERLGIPGMGTGVGAMDPFESAKQIHEAVREVLG